MMKKILFINFIIFTISVFTAAQAPVVVEKNKDIALSYGLVVDCSGSFRSIFQDVLKNAKTIVNKNNPDDETFVLSFVSNDKMILQQQFTNDNAKLNDAISQMFVQGGSTTIFDAIYVSAKNLVDKSKKNENRKRILVLITDGEDRASQTTSEELIKYLKDNKIQIYSIGVLTELSKFDRAFNSNKTVRQVAKDNLENLTKESNGKVFFVENKISIEIATENLLKELRTQ